MDVTLSTVECYINVNGKSPEPYQLIYPTVFSIKTVGDLIAELKQLVDSGSPQGVIRAKTKEILRKQYPDKDQELEDQLFLLQYDLYYSYSLDQKVIMRAQNIMSELEFKKSVISPALLDKYHRLNPNFTISESNYDIIAAWVDKEVAGAMPVETRQPLLLPYNPGVQTKDGELPEDPNEDLRDKLIGTQYQNNGASQLTV
jgi:hypothetical protein